MQWHKEDQEWLTGLWSDIKEKCELVMARTGSKIPYTTTEGVFDDKFQSDPTWWTNGFWGGMVMYMYEQTKDDKYLSLANDLEERMDQALFMPEGLHHDVGFMWYLTSGKNYQLTGDSKARRRMLMAADLLMSRFSINGGYIVAWNGADRQGWSIIDSMMNIPLLFYTAKDTGYERYKDVAIAHANKIMKDFVRIDGSVNHIVVFDHETGEVLETKGGQGYENGSSWSRGQAWAINGFTQAYDFTGDQAYLDTAKKVANYFIANVAQTDYMPAIDFRSPASPRYIDTTAAMIAASGLVDLAKTCIDSEQELYQQAALSLLKAVAQQELNLDHKIDALVMNGSEAYHHGVHMTIIYGDYYLLETMIKILEDMK